MAYIESWSTLKEFIDTNGIVRWNIARSKGNQSNDNVFLYNSDLTFEDNIQKTARLLDMFAGDMLYFVGWNNDKTRTNGFSTVIQYPQHSSAVSTSLQMNGVSGAFDRETLTSDIRRQLKNEFDQERLSRERKEFEENKREFDRKQESVVGLLVHYLAPVAQQLAGKLPLPKVAGIDAEEPVQAQPIHAAPSEPVAEQPAPAEEEEPFEDWEAEKLMSLMQRFKAVEPQYIALMEKVVTMAESGDSTYTMAKNMLLQ